ncbi:MAG: hypothetical protein AAGA58_12515 [Verrucomicrobiota bacterium]
MKSSLPFRCCIIVFLSVLGSADAQVAPHDNPPPVEPPYFRVRYEASEKPGELIFPVQYTVWIPEGVKTLRGVVVHQHGCGEGSCLSGQTGAFDLHWQALARKHDCALMAPSYEQPQEADCGMWCDPRNGSGDTFKRALVDLGEESGHPELAKVPWALWGHSGGGVWTGGMTLLYPDRVAAVWLRSGVPLLEPNPDRPERKPHEISEAALGVPFMCNPGTKEGVTEKEGRFARVWPGNEAFFRKLRGMGGLVGVAVDPLTGHECGNQRYMAIPWLDACLTARLPDKSGDPLNPMPTEGAWLAPLLGETAVPAAEFEGDVREAVWLPNEAVARSWMHYVRDTEVPDTTPPPAPFDVQLEESVLTWNAEADLESGIAFFAIERDGERIATVPEKPSNRFGRPLFQGLQYSDTPAAPLVQMEFVDTEADPEKDHEYCVISFNTVGLSTIDEDPDA